jgi:hypothetical protein
VREKAVFLTVLASSRGQKATVKPYSFVPTTLRARHICSFAFLEISSSVRSGRVAVRKDRD